MIHSFLLIGQSNMAGRGLLDEAIPVNDSDIKILRNGRWVKMFRPINPDRRTSGVNLAESFAEKYAEKHGVEVGLICCADGGTCLEQWKKGEILYENAVFHLNLARRTSTVAGILWHQGEGDCSKELCAAYEERFLKFLDDFRADTETEDLPFIIGGLGDFLSCCPLDENLKNYTEINKAFKNICNKRKFVAFADATGLTANSDNLHFNSKSLYEFGLRYFEQYEKISSGRKLVLTENTDNNRRLMEEL